MAGEAPITEDPPSEESKEAPQHDDADEQEVCEDDPVDESGWIDLFSGKIKARLLKEGTGPVPELKQDVICTYEVRTFADAEVATPLQICKEGRVRMGEGDCPPAVELGLRRMKEGEVCELFSVPNMAWGPGGRPAVGPEEKEVPGGVELHFRVELHKCLTPDTSFTAMADEMIWRKSSGTDYFRRKDFPRARRAYRAALDVYKNMGPPPEDLDQREAEAERLDNLAADCGANLAAVHLELGDTPLAKDAATSALEVNPNHPKALYRAAKASLMLHDHEECDLALKRLEELQPDDTGVRKLRADLRKAQQQYAAKSKKFAAKLWEGPREGYEERQAKKAHEDDEEGEAEAEAEAENDDHEEEESGGEEETEDAEPEDNAEARAKAKTTFTRLLNSILAVVCGSLAIFAYVVWVSRRRQGGWQIPLLTFIALMGIVSIICIAREVMGIGFKAPEVVDAQKKNN